MLDALRPDAPPGASEIALWAGLGTLSVMFAVYPPPGEYDALGGFIVHDRGDLTVVGTALAASLMPAIYALRKLTGIDEWFDSLTRSRRLLILLLACFAPPATMQLVSIPVITVKSVLVGLGSSILLVTLARVALAKRAGSGPSVG